MCFSQPGPCHTQSFLLTGRPKKNTGINDDEDSDETSDEEDNHLATSSKERKKSTTKINPKKMKKHPNYRYNDVTMLTPVDPTANVVVNNTKKTIKTKVNKKAPIFEIAPGEGKIPTNWLREKDNDIDSFPELHVEGKYGLDHERTQKLSRAKYFGQRIMNENTMYSENPDYVFMAQQACERYAIEREIHMAMSHGSIESNDKGEMSLVPSEDAFNIFQKIPGTPAYWKSFKNELYAKIEALGPFHVFFTKSCAEMKWAYVLLEVLKVKLKRNLKIMYLDNFMIDPDGKLENVAWDGETTTVLLYDNDLSDIDLKSNEEKLEDTEEREVELKTQINKIIQNFKRYQEEVANEKNDDPEKMDIIREKLATMNSLDFHLEDETQQNELIQFLIQLEDDNNKLKIDDVEFIATTMKVGERKKIMTLDAYLNRYLKQHSINKTDFLKDHFLLITQIFDKRAHDFLETVLKEEGIVDFVFRVEWQLRGLPHIHGVGWLRQDLLENCLDESGSFLIDTKPNEEEKNVQTNKAVTDLIEKWISCSKSTGDDKLDAIVKENQMHKHTKYSCMKSGHGCRFGFPRPPSNRCMISRPVNEIYHYLDEEEQQSMLEEAKTMMTKVKTALNDLEDGCTDYDHDLEKFLSVYFRLFTTIRQDQSIIMYEIGSAVLIFVND